MGKRSHSIQSQLIGWLACIIVALYGISGAGTFLFMRHALTGQVDRHLERLAEDFIAETHLDSGGKIVSGYHDLGLADYQSPDRETSAYYELRAPDGTPLFKSPSLRDQHLPCSAPGPDLKTSTIALPDNRRGRAIFVTFEPVAEAPRDGARRSTMPVHLTMAENTANLSKTLWILATTLALTAAALASVTCLFVRILVRRACRPIVELGELTRAISPEQRDARLPIGRAPLELHPLVEQFNNLVARFQGGITRERRFSIDIAHELRTPLAELQVLLDIGMKSQFPKFEPGSIEDPRVIYENSEAITKRMRKLVGTLTSIYRGESGEPEVDFQPVEIGKILEEAISVFPEKDRKRFSRSDAPPNQSRLETDPELLRAVFDNLLGNSVVHSPADSPVFIRLDGNCVTIENLAPGLTPGELEALDEPFWQKDAARSNPDRRGLGLTIVAVYVRLLQGSMSRQLIEGSLRTRLTLPDRHCSG